MKKLVIVTFAVLMMAPVFAQKGFKLGVYGGPQWTMMLNEQDSDDPFTRYEVALRAAFGVFGDYHFTDNVGVGLGLGFSAQGQRYEDAGILKLNYFKLPIFLSFNSNPESVAMFMGRIGPTLNFRTKAEWDFEDGLPPENQEAFFEKFVFGLTMAFHLGFNAGDWVTPYFGLQIDGMLTDAMVDIPGRDISRNVAALLEIGVAVNIRKN